MEKLVWTGSVDDLQTPEEREYWRAYWAWAESFDIEINEPEPTFHHLPRAARQRIRTRFENMAVGIVGELEELERRGLLHGDFQT